MSDRIKKLLNYALNPAASKGESENAAAKAIAEARNLGFTDSAQFAKAIGGVVVVETAVSTDDSEITYARQVEMPFGKYYGDTLGEIYQKDIGYLEWLLNKCEKMRPALRRAVEIVLGVDD